LALTAVDQRSSDLSCDAGLREPASAFDLNSNKAIGKLWRFGFRRFNDFGPVVLSHLTVIDTVLMGILMGQS
jgi:hypothetical protein